MDMDYDIPLPEELESLEADSYFHDDHDFYPDLDLPEQHPPDSPPFLHPQINGHNKRPRSDAPDSPLDDTQLPSDEKRTKIVDRDIVEDEEEDQRRYSPPLLAVDTEDVRVVEEKILPSYAFEIDGECMPVRARGGDMVYAKMCRFATEERVKSFHFLCVPLSHASSHFGGSRLAGLIVISLSKNPRCLDGTAVTVLIVASIYNAVIGNLLGSVTMFLGHGNRGYLIGRAMHNDDLDKILHFLKNEPVVDSIHDFKSEVIGPRIVSICDWNFNREKVVQIYLEVWMWTMDKTVL